MTKPKDADEGFDSSDCSLAFTPEEQADFDEAMKSWIPYWRKPRTPDEWGRLLLQRWSFAESARTSHDEAVAMDAPLFLRQLTAKSKYQSERRFQRTRRRAADEKRRVCENLLHALGLLRVE
jgi:hypothetical protein